MDIEAQRQFTHAQDSLSTRLTRATVMSGLAVAGTVGAVVEASRGKTRSAKTLAVLSAGAGFAACKDAQGAWQDSDRMNKLEYEQAYLAG